MIKLFISLATLFLVSFTAIKPAARKELPFCEGVQTIIQKMKTGNEATLQGYEYEDYDYGDWYESNIQLTGWVSHVVANEKEFSFVTETAHGRDVNGPQAKFADIRSELITCLKLDRKKAVTDEGKRFDISTGTIRILLSLGASISEVPYKEHYLQLYIFKSKR